MFIPGCGCCGGGGCKPCAKCDALCLGVLFSGFAHSTSNCHECSFLEGVEITLRRDPDPTLTFSASVESKLGVGAVISLTTRRNETDGSYTIAKADVAKGGYLYEPTDVVTFASNGCIASTPELSLTVMTIKPTSSTLQVIPTSGGNFTAASASVSYSSVGQSWVVSKITKTSGGAGFSEGQAVTLTVLEEGVVTVTAATAVVASINRLQPAIDAVIESSSGQLLSISRVVSPGTDESGKLYWSVTGLFPSGTWPAAFSQGQSVTFSVLANTVVLAAASATANVDQDGRVTSFTIANGGQYFATTGQPTQLTLLSGGSYYKPGVITKVTLNDGGVIWGPRACEYSGTACGICPDAKVEGWTGKTELVATAKIEATQNSIVLNRREYYSFGGPAQYAESVVLSGSQASVNEDGSPVPCDKFTFTKTSVSGCAVNGNVILQNVSCEQEAKDSCEMPDQITVSLSGMGNLFVWQSRNGGVPGMSACPDPAGGFDEIGGVQYPKFVNYTPFCGQCDGASHDISIRGGGTAAGIAGYGGRLVVQDFSNAVLDLQPRQCGPGWSWSGYAPAPPTEGAVGGLTSVDCRLTTFVGVAVNISPVNAGTEIIISPPSEGGDTATAEVTAVNSSGSITQVALTSAGSGYARQVFSRTQPTISGTVAGGGGSGATVSVALYQTGEAGSETWGVESVAVGNQGSGYTSDGTIEFQAAEGTTVEFDAGGVAFLERVEPTVTVTAPGGSGASLSVELAESVDYLGLTEWYVESVAVSSGGSGYTDGAEVTFSTDDIEANGAVGVIVTVKEEPDVAATVAGGGASATLSVTLTQDGIAWAVSGVSITGGGSGYSLDDTIEFSTSDTAVYEAYGYVSAVDEDGAVTAVVLSYGGSYYRSTGVIESVSIQSYGSYYGITGKIGTAFVTSPGSYHVLTPSGVAVDAPTVSFSSPTATLHATAFVEIDVDPESIGFGQIIGINVAYAGAGYNLSGTGWALTVNFSGVQVADSFVSISAPGSGGAQAEATVSAVDSAGGISAVEITSVGDGYAVEITERAQPVVEAAITILGTGSGAALTVTLQQNGITGSGSEVWAVVAVSVAAAGSGYDGVVGVSFIAGEAEGDTAQATAYIGREQPVVAAEASGGSDASLAVSLEQLTDFFGQNTWRVSDITIEDAGEGYAVDDEITVASDGITVIGSEARVSEVDAEGAILAIDIQTRGEYYKSTGQISSVYITHEGAYYRTVGTGDFQSTNPSVTFSSSTGVGAEGIAIVDTNPESEGFGGVTSIMVTKRGQGYGLIEADAIDTDLAGDIEHLDTLLIRQATEGASRSQPSIAARIEGSGGGATASASVVQVGETGSGNEYWTVSGVSGSGGSGYSEGTSVVFDLEAGAVASPAATAVAIIGRSAPTFAASLSGVSYSQLTVNVSESTDAEGRPVWSVESIDITTDGFYRYEPTVTATAGGSGTGAQLSVSLIRPTGEVYWEVDSVVVLAGGSGYQVGDAVVIETVHAEDVQAVAAVAQVSGSGAIESVAIVERGAYARLIPMQSGDSVVFSINGDANSQAAASLVVETIGQGLSVSVFVESEGAHYVSTGVIESVVVTNGGVYYKLVLPQNADPRDCIYYAHLQQPFGARASIDFCPTELLARTYTMRTVAFQSPFGDPYGNGLNSAEWCHTPGQFGGFFHTFFSFGNGQIQVSIAPG